MTYVVIYDLSTGFDKQSIGTDSAAIFISGIRWTIDMCRQCCHLLITVQVSDFNSARCHDNSNFERRAIDFDITRKEASM
jgi:hypothetical protein